MQNELDELFPQADTQDLSTLSTLSLFETSKQQRKSFAEDVIAKLADGQADPLKVHLQVKMMENIIEIFTDRKKYPQTAIEYQGLILQAAERQGKKFQYQNADFSIKEVGTAYDFSQCNDPEITALLAQQEAVKKLVEGRKEFLKVLPIAGMDYLDKSTGEMIKIYPPSKASTTSVSVTLK